MVGWICEKIGFTAGMKERGSYGWWDMVNDKEDNVTGVDRQDSMTERRQVTVCVWWLHALRMNSERMYTMLSDVSLSPHDYKHTHRPSSHPLPTATQLSLKGLEIKVQLNKYIKICLLLDKNFSGRHVICSQQCARQQQSSWTVVDIDR